MKTEKIKTPLQVKICLFLGTPCLYFFCFPMVFLVGFKKYNDFWFKDFWEEIKN